jgi:hypothetical protein
MRSVTPWLRPVRPDMAPALHALAASVRAALCDRRGKRLWAADIGAVPHVDAANPLAANVVRADLSTGGGIAQGRGKTSVARWIAAVGGAICRFRAALRHAVAAASAIRFGVRIGTGILCRRFLRWSGFRSRRIFSRCLGPWRRSSGLWLRRLDRSLRRGRPCGLTGRHREREDDQQRQQRQDDHGRQDPFHDFKHGGFLLTLCNPYAASGR